MSRGSLYLAAATVCGLAWFAKSRLSKYPPLPPGPPGEPILGHTRVIPPEKQEILFYELAKVYGTIHLFSLKPIMLRVKFEGDVIHLRFPGRHVIVLNSVEAAVDLLERRGAIYSDRPNLVIFELYDRDLICHPLCSAHLFIRLGWTRTLSFIRYGKLFQLHRRLLQDYLNAKKVTEFQHIQTMEANAFLQNLLRDPENRQKFITRFF
jgi:hypothetical protein